MLVELWLASVCVSAVFLPVLLISLCVWFIWMSSCQIVGLRIGMGFGAFCVSLSLCMCNDLPNTHHSSINCDVQCTHTWISTVITWKCVFENQIDVFPLQNLIGWFLLLLLLLLTLGLVRCNLQMPFCGFEYSLICIFAIELCVFAVNDIHRDLHGYLWILWDHHRNLRAN